MATMEELPYELLYYIILLLVQSPVGGAEFARIISVCRKFLLYAEDEHILKLVNFDLKLEFKNFYRYQHLNSLLIKCSGAGNVAARFLLGKVILVSSSQLLLSEWQKVDCGFHPCDFVSLSDLSCILATNVRARNHNVGSFMAYFLPEQLSAGKISQTRLVHYQLVKLFLLNGSHRDFIKMNVFLESYFRYFIKVIRQGSPIFYFIRLLVILAGRVRTMEKLVKTKESFMDGYRDLREFVENPSEYSYSKNTADVNFLLDIHVERCKTVGVDWRQAMYSMYFVEELWRNGMSNLCGQEYSRFNKVRAKTIECIEHGLFKFRHVKQEL